MKQTLTTILLLSAIWCAAQQQVDSLRIKQTLRIGNTRVTGISTNTTNGSKSDGLLITERAAKMYADAIATGGSADSALFATKWWTTNNFLTQTQGDNRYARVNFSNTFAGNQIFNNTIVVKQNIAIDAGAVMSVLNAGGTAYNSWATRTSAGRIDLANIGNIDLADNVNINGTSVLQRSSHTGVQAIATITGLLDSLNRRQNIDTTITTLTYGSSITWNVNSKPSESRTLTLTGNVTSFNLSNVATNGFYTLRVVQDGTGGRTITGYNSNIKWIGGTAPTITAAANAVDVITFWYVNPNINALAVQNLK
jgi:hypothetical protein